MDLNGFAPSGERAAALDARMHSELGKSLFHVSEALKPLQPEFADRVDAVAARIDSGMRVPPMAFGRYFEMTEAVLLGDEDVAEAALNALEACPPRADARQLRRLGAEEDAPLLDVFLERNAGSDLELAEVDVDVAARFDQALDAGLTLMATEFPELHSEITTVLQEVLVAKAADPEKVDFDGSSHYQFWGLVMLNPVHHETPLQIIELLAHEVSHMILFGMTIHEPLVFNPDDELYPSPLREDDRPMDGIFHAAYVSARMAMAMERLAASATLSDEDREWAENAAATDRENFAKGDAVIREHARLSETGKQVIGSARDWMAANAALSV